MMIDEVEALTISTGCVAARSVPTQTNEDVEVHAVIPDTVAVPPVSVTTPNKIRG
jgi:hypothetical protein